MVVFRRFCEIQSFSVLLKILRDGYLKKGKTLRLLYITPSTKERTYSMILISTLKEWTSHMITIL